MYKTIKSLKRSKLRNSRNQRRGTVAVEVAMIAPFIFLIVFGLMEWARFEMIRQAAATAAFNAAREGTIPGMTNAEIESSANAILDVYSVSDATVTGDISSTESSVTIAIPLSQNSWFLGRFFGGSSINRSFKLAL
jgi:Flp pilus assembly protein TadG